MSNDSRNLAAEPHGTAQAACSHGRTWLYDKGRELNGQPKLRHKWDEPHAGFVGPPKALVGKCPNNVSMETAAALLNSGIPCPIYDDDDEEAFPTRIYNVHNGVIYEAAVTQANKSYHAYPWRGTMPKKTKLRLEQLAALKGESEGFADWYKEHFSG